MKYLFVIIICTLNLSAFSQGEDKVTRKRFSQEYEEKMESRKIAYISDKLELTSEEAQEFWPIYNEMKAERKKMREAEMALKEMANDQSVDANKSLEQFVNLEEKKLNQLKVYIDKMKRSIGSEKTLLLFGLERSFKEEMLGRFRDKMGWKKKEKRSKSSYD